MILKFKNWLNEKKDFPFKKKEKSGSTDEESPEESPEESEEEPEEEQSGDSNLDKVIADTPKLEGDAPPDDFSTIPFSEKIKMTIDMIREYGLYANNYKIGEEGENIITVDGKADKDLKTNLESLAKDLELELNIEDKKIEGSEDFMTRIIIKNIMDYKKFRDIIKIQKEKEDAASNPMGFGGQEPPPVPEEPLPPQ